MALATCLDPDLTPIIILVPRGATAPFGDTTLALTQCILKEEKISCQSETSSDTQMPLYGMCIIDIAEIHTVAMESGTFPLEESDPFIHSVTLQGPQGEVVCIQGVFDDGATINMIDSRIFTLVKHDYQHQRSLISNCILCMADGLLVPSSGKWVGIIEVRGVSLKGAF